MSMESVERLYMWGHDAEGHSLSHRFVITMVLSLDDYDVSFELKFVNRFMLLSFVLKRGYLVT